MKIIIIPGVGYQSKTSPIKCLGEKIKKNLSDLSCEYEIFNWDHAALKKEIELASNSMELRSSGGTAYDSLRSFVTEVILDFEFAIKYGGLFEVPEADYYIGHSAGSLFATSQKKPSATMGSPIALVKYMPKQINSQNAFVCSVLNNEQPVINFVNRYDVVAYPLDEPNVKNVYFSGSKFNPLAYFPLTAHMGYWESNFVVNEITKHIRFVLK